MFSTKFIIYISVGHNMGWVPEFSGIWGEATHFVHPDGLSTHSKGIPLNREWSVQLQWLFFHCSLTYTKDLPYDEDITSVLTGESEPGPTGSDLPPGGSEDL